MAGQLNIRNIVVNIAPPPPCETSNCSYYLYCKHTGDRCQSFSKYLQNRGSWEGLKQVPYSIVKEQQAKAYAERRKERDQKRKAAEKEEVQKYLMRNPIPAVELIS